MHHLAVWMIEESKNKEAATESAESSSIQNTSESNLSLKVAKETKPVLSNTAEGTKTHTNLDDSVHSKATTVSDPSMAKCTDVRHNL